MKQRNLIVILGLELLVIAIVTSLFRLVPSKAHAAIGASLAFIAIGVWINVATLRWDKFYFSPTFWMAQVHLFFSAIPLLVYRLLNFNTGFDQIEIFGIPGPEFHEVATRIYMGLLAATLAELAWVFVKQRNQSIKKADS